MKIAPYKRRPRSQPLGLVTSTRRVLMEDGTRPRLRDVPKGIRVYADAHLVNERFLRRGDGKALSWNDRPVRWLADLEHSVYLLQGYPGESEQTMDGLVLWRDSLASLGARIGSPSAASLSLFRTTIDGPIYLGSDRPRVSMVLGGRQEAFVRPGVYGSFAHVDLRAAYARTLGELVYPGGSWREWNGPLPADPELPMLVRARVHVPAGIVPPLPRRPRRKPAPGLERLLTPVEYPNGTTIQGIYNLVELRAAEAAGCGVRPIRAWVHVGVPRTPFALWWELISWGRELPGYAGTLFKLMGNTLWGRFALDGAKTLDAWVDGRRISSRIPGPDLNPAYGAEDVSELVASAVRARLYTELIRPAGQNLLSVHTDGGLVRLAGVPPLETNWRVKDHGSLLVYLGPQMYAYRSHGSRTITYVASGFAPGAAASSFAGLCAQAIGWPPSIYGDSIPTRDRRRLAKLTEALGSP